MKRVALGLASRKEVEFLQVCRELVDAVLAGEREQGPIGLGFRIDERTVVCLIVDDVLATTNDAISL